MTSSADRSAVRVWQRLVELERQSRLVEVECRRGLGLGEIDLRGLVEEEVALRRPACRREGWWSRSRCTRMERTTGGSVRKARILIWPPQLGQRSGSTS